MQTAHISMFISLRGCIRIPRITVVSPGWTVLCTYILTDIKPTIGREIRIVVMNKSDPFSRLVGYCNCINTELWL